MEDIWVGKYLVKADRYYTKDHEWALVKGNRAWVGITDYAQKELGDIVYVDLPSVGEEFEVGDTLANVESVKSVSPVYAPLSGSVVEVNEALNDEPGLVNESPYEDGWMVVLELKDPSEVEDLLVSKGVCGDPCGDCNGRKRRKGEPEPAGGGNGRSYRGIFGDPAGRRDRIRRKGKVNVLTPLGQRS
jgi:glycine cleavage system H protein